MYILYQDTKKADISKECNLLIIDGGKITVLMTIISKPLITYLKIYTKPY
jgi:hypothetical protein